ncbi:MAG: TolC family protein [Paludibacteraceae bacterium]|nr:TolC family protein [Paludibacteraceae bacterium]
MKRLLFLLGCLCSLALYAEVLTLQQCIDSALLNNLDVQKQGNQYASQRLQYAQSKADISPTISGSAGQNWIFGRSIGADNIYYAQNSSQTTFNLSANIVLFDGLQMKYNIDQARANMQASEANMLAIQSQIKMNISSMYLQVLLCKELLIVAENQLEDTHLKIKQDSALVAQQRLPAGELYTLQAQAAREELEITQRQNNLQLALLDLAQAIELENVDGFDIVVPSDEELNAGLLPNNDEVYRIALQNRPEIKAMEYQVQANESALKGAKSAYSPTLSAGANVGTGYYDMQGAENQPFGTQMRDNFSASVGLNLHVPIYDKNQTTTRVKQQKLALENARLDLEQQKNDLRKEIDQAYFNAKNASAEQISAEKAERAAAEALRYATQKYEAGRSTLYEYQEARNNYLQAQSTRLQAQYNYLFRLRILQYYQGVL